MTYLEKIPMIQAFVDVFLESIYGFLPMCDIDFTIELMFGADPVSTAPYHMSILELTKTKMKLQELLDKGYIHPVYALGELSCYL